MAEASLPAAVYLAETLAALVTLFHVIERGAPREIHGDRHLSDPMEAQEYLDEVAARSFTPEIHVPPLVIYQVIKFTKRILYPLC
jgi:hypothetical protein